MLESDLPPEYQGVLGDVQKLTASVSGLPPFIQTATIILIVNRLVESLPEMVRSRLFAEILVRDLKDENCKLERFSFVDGQSVAVAVATDDMADALTKFFRDTAQMAEKATIKVIDLTQGEEREI